MKQRKPIYIIGLYTRDDAGEIVPLEGKYKQKVADKAALLVAELETGHRHEFVDEGA
jgi:hypothetical protein